MQNANYQNEQGSIDDDSSNVTEDSISNQKEIISSENSNSDETKSEKITSEGDIEDTFSDEKDEDAKNEQFRLGGRPPFSTLCHLIVGPLFSQIAQSLYGLMDTFWISKSIGPKGMTVMSIVSAIDFINIAFAQYFHFSEGSSL